MKRLILVLFMFAALTGCEECPAQTNVPIRPDSHMTPGVALTNVTIEQIVTRGYAKTVRNVPESEKRAVFIEYFGAVPAKPGKFEIDHLISLELGGANSISNLWPQSYTGQWNAHDKDKLEDRMAALLRADLKENGHDHATALLKQFQQEISTDWIVAYQKYVTTTKGEK